MIRQHIEYARRLVAETARSDGMVNVPAIADAVRRRHPDQSLVELERAVLCFAELSGAPIVFERPVLYDTGLLLEFVTDGEEEIEDALTVGVEA